MPPILSCTRYRKLYSAFRDGALPATRAAEMQGHMDGCEPCARRHHALEFGVRLLRATMPREAERPAAVHEVATR